MIEGYVLIIGRQICVWLGIVGLMIGFMLIGIGYIFDI